MDLGATVPHAVGGDRRSRGRRGVCDSSKTPIFTEDVSQELSPKDYRQLQLALMLRPEQGPLIVGSGGLRKIRWRRAGMGKRGGLRVIYYWEAASETFYMLAVYRKSAQADLSAQQVRILRRLVAQEFK